MNKYLKSNIDINNDSENWTLLKSSSLFLEQYKKENSEIELIESYISCMKLMHDDIISKLNIGRVVIDNKSLCIPYMYICRHIIELIFKYKLERNKQGVIKGHVINDLWQECKKIEDINNLCEYDELIELLTILDDNGQKLRYIKDNKGNIFDNNPIFLNIDLIYLDTIKLKDLLV